VVRKCLGTIVNQVNDYFVDISTGNFSTQLNSDSNDEFGKLFNNLNKLIADLKGNTNTVLKLMNDIQGTALPNLDLSGVLHLIVKSAVDGTIADSAAILVA
jgi:methyl-accepting chemotaxis protein